MEHGHTLGATLGARAGTWVILNTTVFIMCWIPPHGCPTYIGKNSKDFFLL